MNRGNFSRGARVNPPAPAKLSAPSAFVGFAALVRRDWPEISKEDYLLMAAAAWNVHEAAGGLEAARRGIATCATTATASPLTCSNTTTTAERIGYPVTRLPT